MLTSKLTRGFHLGTLVRQMTTNTSGDNIERSVNRVTLIGRSGNPPQKRGTDSNPVVVFSLATNVSMKSDDGKTNQKTEWHRICVFKPVLRDIVYDYLKKGQRLYVTGRISYGELQSPETNQKTMITSIIAEDIIFFNTSSSTQY